jgi:hypothetical protein
MCLADRDHGSQYRLSRREGRLAFGAPGVWLDVDFLGPGHKSTNLPESIEQVIEILHRAGLARFMPTMAVHSGGGLHLYWLFRESWIGSRAGWLVVWRCVAGRRSAAQQRAG